MAQYIRKLEKYKTAHNAIEHHISAKDMINIIMLCVCICVVCVYATHCRAL